MAGLRPLPHCGKTSIEEAERLLFLAQVKQLEFQINPIDPKNSDEFHKICDHVEACKRVCEYTITHAHTMWMRTIDVQLSAMPKISKKARLRRNQQVKKVSEEERAFFKMLDELMDG